MNSLLVLALFAVCSTATASIIGGIGLVAPGAVLRGPSSAATVVGPSGGVISSAAQAGAIAAPGLVAAPVLGAGAVIAGPSGTIISNGLGLGSPLWGAPLGLGKWII